MSEVPTERLMDRYQRIETKLRANPRRWLVTGVAGFIGSNILERLLSLGQDVVGLDNFATGYRRNLDDVMRSVPGGSVRFHFVEGDIRDADTCLRVSQDVDFVLHQAALGSVPRSILDPALCHAVNVDGTFNMLVAAKEAGVRRFVYASSSAVYGDSPDLPKREAVIGAPLSPYALSKRICELNAEMMTAVYGLETVGLRYFNVFGRRQDPRSTYAAVIPQWIRRLLRGEVCTINGDGETSRDFCLVEHIVQANILAATGEIEGPDQIYNVGQGGQTTLNQLYRLLRDGLSPERPELAGLEPDYQDFRAGDVRQSLADITKIRAALGYEPRIPFAKGIERTLAWYAERSGTLEAEMRSVA
jgi:UDP-N-acetylglucosamine 4-epimerase